MSVHQLTQSRSDGPETQTYLQNGAFFKTKAVFQQTNDVREIHAEEMIDLTALRRSVTHCNNEFTFSLELYNIHYIAHICLHTQI